MDISRSYHSAPIRPHRMIRGAGLECLVTIGSHFPGWAVGCELREGPDEEIWICQWLLGCVWYKEESSL